MTSAKKGSSLCYYRFLVAKERSRKEDKAMKNKLFFTFLLCLILAAYTQAYTPEYDSNSESICYFVTGTWRDIGLGLSDKVYFEQFSASLV